jgi:hypothetical protein
METEECAICLDSLKNEESTLRLSCKHHFHGKCISSWFGEGHNTCPVCRNEYYTKHIQRPHPLVLISQRLPSIDKFINLIFTFYNVMILILFFIGYGLTTPASELFYDYVLFKTPYDLSLYMLSPENFTWNLVDFFLIMPYIVLISERAIFFFEFTKTLLQYRSLIFIYFIFRRLVA